LRTFAYNDGDSEDPIYFFNLGGRSFLPFRRTNICEGRLKLDYFDYPFSRLYAADPALPLDIERTVLALIIVEI